VAVSEPGTGGGSGSTYTSAVGKIPMDGWFCLQLVATVSNTQGSSKIDINQSTVLTLPTIDTQPGEGLNYFTYGVLPAEQSQSNGTVYWDDVIVDTLPVPCSSSPVLIPN
jgi:hypothetical protein